MKPTKIQTALNLVDIILKKILTLGTPKKSLIPAKLLLFNSTVDKSGIKSAPSLSLP